MRSLKSALMFVLTTAAAPCIAVESVYLDDVPVANPGHFLAPENFYLEVPPPALRFNAGGSLVPLALYDINVTRPNSAVTPTGGSVLYAGGTAGTELDEEDEADDSAGRLRVVLKAGLDHASDVPLAVLREHLAEAEDIELVSDSQSHDVVVEVETMRPAAAATVFIVINAYKQVDGKKLIFYNTFGYMGDLKLLSASAGYGDKLEAALLEEAGLESAD